MIQLIFTTSNPGDFVAVLAHCQAQGLEVSITGKPPGKACQASQESPWEASPAVMAFRAAGMARLKPEKGETPHAAAIRRLKGAGIETAGMEIWAPGESPSQDMPPEDRDDDDL
jgi:hypothetical protein